MEPGSFISFNHLSIDISHDLSKYSIFRKDDDGFWAIRGKRGIPEETGMLYEETYEKNKEHQDIDDYSKYEYTQEDIDKLHKELLDIINSLLEVIH